MPVILSDLLTRKLETILNLHSGRNSSLEAWGKRRYILSRTVQLCIPNTTWWGSNSKLQYHMWWCGGETSWRHWRSEERNFPGPPYFMCTTLIRIRERVFLYRMRRKVLSSVLLSISQYPPSKFMQSWPNPPKWQLLYQTLEPGIEKFFSSIKHEMGGGMNSKNQ
jgi:hypothetical protein